MKNASGKLKRTGGKWKEERVQRMKILEDEGHWQVISIWVSGHYRKERWAWEDFEAECEDLYLDNSNLWDESYFHLLLNESTPLCVENVVEGSQEKVMVTSFYLTSFPSVVFLSNPYLAFSNYVYDYLNIYGSIYVYVHYHIGSLKHRT